MKRTNVTKHNKKGGKASWRVQYESALGMFKSRFTGQDDQLKQLAAICATHQVSQELKNPPIAPRVHIAGKTSSGKSSAAIALAEHLKLPHLTINCAMLSPESFKGTTLSDAFAGLLNQRGTLAKIQQEGAVIQIEEFDKLCVRAKEDPVFESLFYSLLPLLGGEIMAVRSSDHDSLSIEVKTNRMIVVTTGAYSWLLDGRFSTPEQSQKSMLREGVPPEVVNRFTHFVQLKSITKNQMKEILRKEIEQILPSYQLQAFTPTLDKITAKHFNSSLGLRAAKVDLHQLLFNEAIKLRKGDRYYQ